MTPDKAPISKLSIGEYIALARELKGWSLRDLEKRTGISNALISQIENGDVKEPGFHKVVRLARALNLGLDRLAETAFTASDFGIR